MRFSIIETEQKIFWIRSNPKSKQHSVIASITGLCDRVFSFILLQEPGEIDDVFTSTTKYAKVWTPLLRITVHDTISIEQRKRQCELLPNAEVNYFSWTKWPFFVLVHMRHIHEWSIWFRCPFIAVFSIWSGIIRRPNIVGTLRLLCIY